MYAELLKDLFEFVKRNDWKPAMEYTTDDFTFKASRVGLTFDRDEFFTVADTSNQLIRREVKLHKIVEINNYTFGIGDIIIFNDQMHILLTFLYVSFDCLYMFSLYGYSHYQK